MLLKIASLGVIQIAGTLINVIRAKVFAVLLGPAGFGVVATIDQLVLSAVQISNLSLPFTALKFLSRSHSLGEEQFRRFYAAFFKAMTWLAIVAVLATVAVIPPRLGQLDAQIALYREPVTIALLGIPATMMLIFFTNVFAARQESAAAVILTVVSSAVILLAGATGCLIGGIEGIYVAVVSASTALMIAVAIFLWKWKHLPAWADSSGVWKELTANSQIIEITFFVFIAVASHSLQLFLARYSAITHVGAEAAGFLQACLAVALSIGAVLASVNTNYFSPFVNRAIPAAEKIGAADRFLPRLVLLYCLGGLAVLLFPHAVMTLLFSREFSPAVALLPWFVVWQCLHQISNIYLQLLIGLDDARGFGVVTSIGNLAAATLCFLLVNRFGLLGIGIGFVVGATITALITGLRLRWKHGLAIPGTVAVLVTYALVGLFLVAAAGRFTTEFSFAGLMARSLTAIAFLTGLWFTLPRSMRADLSGDLVARLRSLKR